MIQDIRLSGTVRKKVSYEGKEIGDIIAGGARLMWGINLKNSSVSGKIGLHAASFNRDALFGIEGEEISDRTRIFPEVVSFTDAEFLGNTSFNGRVFSKNAYFERTIFTQLAEFVGVGFLKEAIFSGAHFKDVLNFDSVIIKDLVVGKNPMLIKNLNLGKEITIHRFSRNSLVIVRELQSNDSKWLTNIIQYAMHHLLRANLDASVMFFEEWFGSGSLPDALELSDLTSKILYFSGESKKDLNFVNYWNTIRDWCLDNPNNLKEILSVDPSNGNWIDSDNED